MFVGLPTCCEACDHGVCDDFCDTGILHQPCVGEGYVCRYGSCEIPCDASACPHGYGCDDFSGECRDFCTNDRDCRSGWECCQSFSGDCDFGTCVRG